MSPLLADVKTIHRINSSLAIVSTPDDTYLVDVNSISNASYEPKNAVFDEYGSHVSIDTALQYGKYSTTVFAGKIAGKPYALLKLSRDIKTGKFMFTSLHEIPGDLPVCALAYADVESSYDGTPKIAFATSTTVYMGTISDTGISGVKVMGTFGAALSYGSVCAIVIRPKKLIVFTSAGNAYDIGYLPEYNGFQDAAMNQMSSSGIVVHDIKTAYGGVVYLATSIGLCVLQKNTIT